MFFFSIGNFNACDLIKNYINISSETTCKMQKKNIVRKKRSKNKDISAEFYSTIDIYIYTAILFILKLSGL